MGIETLMAQGRSTIIISMIKCIWTSRLSIKNSLWLDRFLDHFPEPSSWVAARNNYTRTTAVWSMVSPCLPLDSEP